MSCWSASAWLPTCQPASPPASLSICLHALNSPPLPTLHFVLQEPQRRQLAVVERLSLLFTIFPGVFASNVSPCSAVAGCQLPAKVPSTAAPPPCPFELAHQRSACQPTGRSPKTLAGLVCCLCGGLPLCRFGKQYDKEGAYIRHFLPALKVRCGVAAQAAAALSALAAPHCCWPGPRPGVPPWMHAHAACLARLPPPLPLRRTCLPSTSSSPGPPPWRCSRRRAASSAGTTHSESRARAQLRPLPLSHRQRGFSGQRCFPRHHLPTPTCPPLQPHCGPPGGLQG